MFSFGDVSGGTMASMSHYRYTNTKFWGLLAVCLLLIGGVHTSALLSIRASDRQVVTALRQTARLIAYAEHSAGPPNARQIAREYGVTMTVVGPSAYPPTAIFRRVYSWRGLWYVTMSQTGLYIWKNGNAVLWQVMSAAVLNTLFSVAALLFFGYFHINYRFISHIYRAMIDGMDDLLAVKDAAFRYRIVNQKLSTTLFDKHPKEVIGRTDRELGLPDDLRRQEIASDQRVVTSRGAIHLLERGLTAAGRFVVIKMLKTPFFHANGTFGGIIVCGRDVSEQTKLQEAFAALEDSYTSSEWLLDKLFQTVPEFLYVKDRRHRFVRVSQSMSEFFGVPDMIGLSDVEIMPAADARRYWQDEERLMTGTQETETGTERIVGADGRTRSILMTKTVFRDKRGQVIGLLGIGKDVTELVDRQTAFEFVIEQMTQQTLHQVELQKQKTERFQIEVQNASGYVA